MRVGIIGTGYISTFHAAAYKQLGVEIAAVTDVDKERFLSKQEMFGGAVFCDSVDDILNDSSIDAVSICTTTKAHFEMVTKAAKAGKHIFCEKTMTESGERSAELVAALKGFDKNFQIGYMKRFFPATNKVPELLPEIGEVISGYVRSYQGFEWDKDIYDDDMWRPKDGKPSYIRQFACGGMLNMAGSHMLDLLGFFIGAPAKVYAANWSPASYDAEMNAHALFTMPSRAIVHFEATCSPYSRAGRWQDGWDEKIEINGTRGRIEVFYGIWDKPMNNAAMVRLYKESDKTHTEFTFPKVDAFTEEVRAFVDNCKAGKKSIPGLKEGAAVDKVISACYKSVETGNVVEIG